MRSSTLPAALLLLAALSPSLAADRPIVYLHPDGDDQLSGDSPSTPWLSLARLQHAIDALHFSQGGTILLARGAVFPGSLTLRDLSHPAGAPLVISAYGEGAPPTLTGLVPLSDWEDLGQGRWQTTCQECAVPPTAVTRDGLTLPIARWPNPDEADAGYLYYQSSEGRTSITDDRLASSPNFSGAEAVLRSAAWILDRLPIATHLGPTLTFASPATYAIPKGYGYFIQNHPAALDRDGEWVFDPSTRSITVFLDGTHPADFHFAATVTDTLLSLASTQGVEISDLRLLGARRANFDAQNSSRLTLRRLESLQAGDVGLRCISCRDLLLEDSFIDGALNHGLDVYNCTDCLIQRNRITNIATLAGMGRSGNGMYNGVRFGGPNAVFFQNTVSRTGYLGIDIRGPARIEQNIVSHSNLVKTDGGGIYTWGNRSADIIRNFVSDSAGSKSGVPWNNPATHGIYIDDQCEDMRVLDNTVLSVASHGIFLHNTRSIAVEGNTIIDAGEAQIAFIDDHLGAYTVSETTVRGNVFLARTPGALMTRASTNAGPEFFPAIGELSGNSYCAPFAEPAFLANQSRLSLNQWRNLIASDDSSQLCPHRYPPFHVFEVTALNRVINGNFDNHISSWFGWPSDSLEASWDSGRLRLRHTATAPTIHYDAPIGAIEKGRFYRLRFDAQSDQPNRNLRVYLRKWDPDYRLLAPAYDLPLDQHSRSWEFVFHSTEDEARSLLIFELPHASQVVWLDNVTLEPVLAQPADRTQLVQAEINPSPEPRELTLHQPRATLAGELLPAGATFTIPPFGALLLFEPPR